MKLVFNNFLFFSRYAQKTHCFDNRFFYLRKEESSILFDHHKDKKGNNEQKTLNAERVKRRNLCSSTKILSAICCFVAFKVFAEEGKAENKTKENIPVEESSIQNDLNIDIYATDTPLQILEIHEQLGDFLFRLGKFQEALIQYNKAEIIYSEFTDCIEKAEFLIKKAKVLRLLGNYELSKQDILRSKMISAKIFENNNVHISYAVFKKNLGEFHELFGEIEKAKMHYQKSLCLCQKLENRSSLCDFVENKLKNLGDEKKLHFFKKWC